MEIIEDDKIPVLSGIIEDSDENIMLGVVKQGVIVQYSDRNVALLIYWIDIVTLGIGYLDEITTQDLSEKKKEDPTRRIIPSPKRKVILR